MFKQFLISMAVSGSLMAAAAASEEIKVPGCHDQAHHHRFNCPSTIPGAFTMNWEAAPAFVAALSASDSNAQGFLVRFDAAEYDLNVSFKECFRKAFLNVMPKDQPVAREAFFVIYDALFRNNERQIPWIATAGSESRFADAIRAVLTGTDSTFVEGVCAESIKLLPGSLSVAQAARTSSTALTDKQQDELLRAKLSQAIAQAYFRTTGEDYVYALPFVKGREAAIMALAEKSGFVTVHQPLETYQTFQHLSKVFNGRDTLVLCCGHFSLNVDPYESQAYQSLSGVTVSSGHRCNHDGHITLARTAGIYPDIVADASDPRLLQALSQLQPSLAVIFDEEGAISPANQDVFARLLRSGGKIISNRKIVFTKPCH